jgi:hypothetical protein
VILVAIARGAGQISKGADHQTPSPPQKNVCTELGGGAYTASSLAQSALQRQNFTKATASAAVQNNPRE